LAEGSRAIVAIRPQGIHLRTVGAGIPGMLESRRFLGIVEQFEVVIDGLDVPLRGRTRAPITAPVKTEAAVEIDRAEVLVFAASEA
jgi:iron(III) transport system ATP-binding protein